MSETVTRTSGISRWNLDPAHSQVEFGVRHMMISTVKGSFDELEGEVELNGDDFAQSRVSVEIDASSIDTGNEDRDQHLRSEDFLDVDEFPALSFRSTKVEGTEDSFRLPGDLTIRGETREVVLKGKLLGGGTDPWGNERLAFRAQTTVNRKDFGLTWNQALEAGGVLVGDEVEITLEVQAVEAQEEE